MNLKTTLPSSMTVSQGLTTPLMGSKTSTVRVFDGHLTPLPLDQKLKTMSN
jgi:hypothetical protein